MASTRRLAAIHAADVAEYSRLMGADEEGTHERLQAHLRELANPKIGEHRGRIVKNAGTPTSSQRNTSGRAGWKTAGPVVTMRSRSLGRRVSECWL